MPPCPFSHWFGYTGRDLVLWTLSNPVWYNPQTSFAVGPVERPLEVAAGPAAPTGGKDPKEAQLALF